MTDKIIYKKLNHKEFISELSQKSGYSALKTSELLDSVFNTMIQHLQNGETITIQGFGSFEIRKKVERISINPATKKRMFVPPKLIVTYKPSTSLKDKLK
ncbi:DNA-binding protein HU [termite gut metagenome]|uniref:DNA-binding protein HU n=1 Tax=termite gut metagenome TaxID=433724 RepID=A0A5J4SIC8_9ZZZZ